MIFLIFSSFFALTAVIVLLRRIVRPSANPWLMTCSSGVGQVPSHVWVILQVARLIIILQRDAFIEFEHGASRPFCCSQQMVFASAAMRCLEMARKPCPSPKCLSAPRMSLVEKIGRLRATTSGAGHSNDRLRDFANFGLQ